jgi:hypothetical protein
LAVTAGLAGLAALRLRSPEAAGPAARAALAARAVVAAPVVWVRRATSTPEVPVEPVVMAPPVVRAVTEVPAVRPVHWALMDLVGTVVSAAIPVRPVTAAWAVVLNLPKPFRQAVNYLQTQIQANFWP